MEMYDFLEKANKYDEHVPEKDYVLYIAFEQDFNSKSIEHYWISNNMTLDDYQDIFINKALQDGYIKDLVICDYPLNTTIKHHIENDSDILLSDILDTDPARSLNVRDAIYEHKNTEAIEAYQYFSRFQGEYTRKVDFEMLYNRNECLCSKTCGRDIIENYAKGFYLQSKSSWFNICDRFMTEESKRLNILLSQVDFTDHSLCHIGDPFYSNHGISVDMVEKYMSFECDILTYRVDGDIEAVAETIDKFEKLKTELSHMVFNQLLGYAASQNDMVKISNMKSQGFVPTTTDIQSLETKFRVSTKTLAAVKSIFGLNYEKQSSMSNYNRQHNNNLHM